MDGRTTTTLAEWLRMPGCDRFKPITSHAPRIGIHDVAAIEHNRTWLWTLSDYRVDAISGGVIWLSPKREGYRVNCYAGERLSASIMAETPQAAIDMAYTFVAQHSTGAAHIVKLDTLHGIYIARPTDITEQFTRDDAVALLLKTGFY